MEKNKHVDSYSMMIVAKYFYCEEDYIRIVMVSKKYNNLLEKFRYNPHKSLRLFPNIETQVLYTKNEKRKEGMYQYIYSYQMNLSDYYRCDKTNSVFKKVSLEKVDVENYFFSDGNTASVSNDLNHNKKFDPVMATNCIIPPYVNSLGMNCLNSRSLLNKVELPTSITSLGNYCFKKSGLEAVQLPTSVRVLGLESFAGCPLQTIEFPQSIKKIGGRCFTDCPLKNLKIPDTLWSLGNGCFKNCIYLTSVTLPSSIGEIGDNMFLNCSQLSNIIIPNGITSIGSNCFVGCVNLKRIVLPSTIKAISNTSFDRALKSLHIQKVTVWKPRICYHLSVLLENNGVSCLEVEYTKNDRVTHGYKIPQVQHLGNESFSNYPYNSIDIPTTVTSLGEFCFYNSKKLRNINIPTTVTSIGKHCFEGCPLLENND
ncbi:hypothetical protein QTN25_007591 [Entamoeba marina]